ncbi:MAG TPA: ATP-binding protein [Longimicrobium sp.]|nr:ATP-binding protein [Longimicrobium sp.]
MLHDPAEARLFPTFSPELLDALGRAGETVALAPGEALFAQGRLPYDFWVVLEGEVRVTKEVGGEEWLLAVHPAGGFAAEISILAGTPPIATARAVGAVRALRIEAERFRELVATSREFARVVLPAMTGRSQEVDQQVRQQEKLAALGRMAAGLAHELNNPAAAVKRAAASLEEAVAEAQRAALRLHAHPLAEAEQAFLDRLHAEARGYCASPVPLSPLERSAAEDAVGDWLEARGVEGGWELAAPLVAGCVDPEKLEGVEAVMGPERLEATARWLAAALATAALLRELQQGTQRIGALVQSIKAYSHMDQAPELKETDLHVGLESTLALLAHKLRGGVEVVRDYDASIPKVCVYAGELNQVWTNLIDNAVDAMKGRGRLRVRTARAADPGLVTVEIADDGPGIPPEVLGRIWEPFFTTKGVGEGSGLGLDIARRIVQRRHGGSLRVDSRPGDTRFQITLRVDGPPKEAARAAAGAEAIEEAVAAAG